MPVKGLRRRRVSRSPPDSLSFLRFVTQAGPRRLVAYLSGRGPSLERELHVCIGVVVEEKALFGVCVKLKEERAGQRLIDAATVGTACRDTLRTVGTARRDSHNKGRQIVGATRQTEGGGLKRGERGKLLVELRRLTSQLAPNQPPHYTVPPLKRGRRRARRNGHVHGAAVVVDVVAGGEVVHGDLRVV